MHLAMSALQDRPSVRRLRDALAAAGSSAQVIELAETARTAADAAGHPHCVFATSADELATLTGGAVVDGIGIEI